VSPKRGQASRETFAVTARDPNTAARTGRLITPHGEVRTPVFMPVGTQGTVKGLTPEELRQIGIEILLGNVYHLSLRPGQDALEAAGGLHCFMAWDRPILTDSGGYQVFSLADLRRVDDEGVTFSSPVDGGRIHRLTPESVMEFQERIGVDVRIPLDECPPLPADRSRLEAAVRRTTDWAGRSRKRFLEGRGEGVPPPLLFGIVQGGLDLELRRQAFEQLAPMGFDGYCLGGFAVGEPREAMMEILPETAALLPEDRPRCLMGVGEPLDLIEGVMAGIDLFDCVVPTRHARNGTAYTWAGRLNLRNARFAQERGPIDPDCRCEVCNTYSRMYLRHLFEAREMLGPRLLSYHNLWFYSTLMAEIRRAVSAGRLEALRKRLAPVYDKRLEQIAE